MKNEKTPGYHDLGFATEQKTEKKANAVESER